MMISQPALLCLEASFRRLLGRSDKGMEPTIAVLGNAESTESTIPAVPRLVATPAENKASAPKRGDDVQPMMPHSEQMPLSPSERRARAAALRALALCRGRQFDAARAAFLEAARLDPALDLTRTPDFWKLERGAHEAAIAAYIGAGRDGDAAVLRARVHSTYRPKAVRARPGSVATR